MVRMYSKVINRGKYKLQEYSKGFDFAINTKTDWYQNFMSISLSIK